MIKQGITGLLRTADTKPCLDSSTNGAISLYPHWNRAVTRLNEVRDEEQTYNNRLDTTMADVFNLLSLFFMTIGKTKECPATYSQIASLRVSRSAVRRIHRFPFTLDNETPVLTCLISCVANLGPHE